MTKIERGENGASAVEMDPATGGLLPTLPQVEGGPLRTLEDIFSPGEHRQIARSIEEYAERKATQESGTLRRRLHRG